MANINENFYDLDLSSNDATYLNNSDSLDFTKSIPLGDLVNQKNEILSVTDVPQKQISIEDTFELNLFKPDDSMSTEDIVLAEHSYCRPVNEVSKYFFIM